MITTRRLPNGIRIVMEQMPALSSIAIGIWTKTGAVDEDLKYSGISHFVEHMMFKGTPSRDAKTIASDIEKLGAQMNAFTGKEATCYYVKSVSDKYKEAADVLVDMIENSLFDKKELDRERNVVKEELKMGKDSPDDVCHDALIDILFKGRKLSNSVIGTRTSLDRITHNVMSSYVRDNYVRDSIVVSVAGKFDPEDVCEFFSGKFLSLKESKPERTYPRLEYVKGYRSITKDIQQSHICLGTKCIKRDDERSYAFQILNSILGGGMSSRLFQNIREEKGLAYTVFSNMGTFSSDGYFEIYAGVAHENIRRAIDGIADELRMLAQSSVTQEELESSRAQMVSQYVFSQESTSTRMIINGKNYLLLGKVFDPSEVLKGYRSVSVEDIDEAKKVICDFDEYSASVVSGKKVRVADMMGDRS